MSVRLADYASEMGDEIAVWDETGELSWSHLNERVNRLVNGLRKAGLRDGDTIGLVGGNRHEFLETTSASLTASWVVVPVNWHFSTDEVAYVLENSGAKALVLDAEFLEAGTKAADQAGVGLRLLFGGPRGGVEGFTDYEDLLASASPEEPSPQGAGSTMLYTSGTTGRPKGVKSTLVQVGSDPAAAVAMVDGLLGLLGIPPRGRVLLNAPAYHAGPIVFCLLPVVSGSSIVMRRRWDAAEMLRLIDEHSITTAYAVPTHFVRLLKLPEEVRTAFDGSSLKCVYHTAAPCPPEVKRQMIEWWGPVINELYGASESGGAGTTITSEEWLRKPGSVGKPLPTTEVLILDDDGNPLGPGEVGQVYLRHLLGVDFEYLGDQEKTAAVHAGPGVFTFGDVGHLDEDGYLFLSDRRIDMIISGGVNIYPAEIEAVLVMHPAVADAGVFGVPNEEFGEEVKAAVELAEGFEPDEGLAQELRSFVRQRLAGYKVPRSIDFTQLPRTPTGKLLKRELRAPYWEGRDRVI